MDEKRLEIQGTHERKKPVSGNLRRNSTGKTSMKSEEEILPHYLRASTGSCHDFCKYGRKHDFAEKEKHTILKRFTTKQDEGPAPMKNEIVAIRKKKSAFRLDPSPDPKTPLPESDKPQIEKRNVSSSVKKKNLFSKQASSITKKTDLPVKQASSIAKETNFPMKQASSPAKNIVESIKPANGLKQRPMDAKHSSSLLRPSGGYSVRENIDTNMIKSAVVSKVGVKALVPPKYSLSPKPYVKRAPSLNTRQNMNLKAVSPMKNQIKMRKPEPKLPNHANVAEKILYMIEPKPEKRNAEPTSHGTHSIQFFPTKLSSLSSPSSQEEEQHEESEATVSEYEETENEEVETYEVEENGRPRRSRAVHSEYEDCPPQKLSFRRGKVISLQSETNGPRRLKFRQGRVLGEKQNGKGDIGRRSFRRREGGNDSNDTKPKSDKVVLRHQDVQEKKDAQGLLNNVIEETASKLVETRKSKVKALVGAFETVISLQEGKPTSPKSS